MRRHNNNLNLGRISEICKNHDTLYVFDNAWSTPNINNKLLKYDFKNILLNSNLPDPNFSEEQINIVVHLRGGDAASRKGSICKQDQSKLNDVLVKLQSNNPKGDKCIVCFLPVNTLVNYDYG